MAGYYDGRGQYHSSLEEKQASEKKYFDNWTPSTSYTHSAPSTSRLNAETFHDHNGVWPSSTRYH